MMRTATKIGGCVLIPVALLVVALIGGGAYWWFARGGGDVVGVGLTTSRFLQGVQENNWDQAHSQLSASLQETVTPAALSEAWQQYQATHGAMRPVPDPDGQVRPESRTFFTADPGNLTVSEAGGTETATVQGTMNFATSGPQEVTIRMVKEDGAWKITELPLVQSQS